MILRPHGDGEQEKAQADEKGVALLLRAKAEALGLAGGGAEQRPLLGEKASPGNAAIHEVRLQHPTKRPSFEMRDLDLGLKEDAVAVRGHAVSELDVLDLRPREAPFVVHAHGDEHRPADASAAGPERLRLAGLLVVGVMMEEVAILRDDAS